MTAQATQDQETIDVYRREIDAVDTELLRLLNRRAVCAMEIGKLKRRHNLPIHVPSREQAVLSRLAERNTGPLSDTALREIFTMLFEQMKKLELSPQADPGSVENA